MTSTLSAMLVLLAGLLISFCLKLYRQRRLMKGLPMPPHHPLLGHLPIFAKIVRSLPPDVHPHCYPHYIRQAYGLGPIFYLDTWPLGDPMLIIAGDPEAAHEVTVTHSLPKHRSLGSFLTPLGGSKNLVSMEGPEWKAWRSIFNPGFAPGNLMGLVPSIVEEVEVFARVLGEWADRGEVVILEEVATKVTVDVIGKVVLDTKFNSQTSNNELVSAMRSQVRWSWPTDMYAPIRNLNPIRPFVFWWNTRIMNRYLERELEKRFEFKSGGEMKKRKHVIDLALETYIDEQSPEKKGSGFDETFKKMAINQIKTFIFAGHDTSSSTICWIYHTLHQHPTALAQIRHEHDTVFSTDLSLAPQLLKSTPHLLNKLPYTLAVIKEVMRLFPPASSVRGGEESYSIRNTYPTHGCLVWPQLYALNRDPALFPSPTHFLPERFLPTPTPTPNANPTAPDDDKQQQPLNAFPPTAFRPFEHGPRNCIGQDLALLEIKIVLVLTIRALDVWAVYEEFYKNEGKTDKAILDVEGERAYQILWATAKPKCGLPARVARTERGRGGKMGVGEE